VGHCHYVGAGVDEDVDEAVRLFRECAEKGYPPGWYALGHCCEEVPEALKCYRRGAKLGDPDAQNALGYCYAFHDGVKHDFVRAIRWFRLAAKQGHALAQLHLGNCYDKGKGVPKDLARAVRYFRKAAKQGTDEAQFSLGKCYRDGRGVEKDFAKAERWLRKAAEQGHRPAKNALNRLGDEQPNRNQGTRARRSDSPTHCWIYWDPEFASLNASRGAKFVSADLGSFSAKVGDTLWLVTYRDGELFLTGKLKIGSVEDRQAAENLWTRRGLWDSQEWPPPFPVPSRAHPDNYFDYAKRRVCVFAEAGTEQPYRIIPMGNAVSKLRFQSSGKNQLTVSGNRVLKPQEVVNPRRLTADGGAILQQLWAAQPSA
jgi:hypothetical protein